MTTEKLYYVNQYQTDGTATVLSCTPCVDGFEVILDRTIFYPTGGGQPCDTGTIGGIPVRAVEEREGQVIHFCQDALAIGTAVEMRIDWQRRFSLMQQHSGEHLVSGLIHARYGFENVGFHMGAETVTIDFSGEVGDLAGIERAANEAIYRNIPSEYLYPDAETLPKLAYRSKKELSGCVRLVRFGQIDLCACCGLHVARTGEIGLIKLLSCVKFHNGSRIELLCGKRALDYLSAVYLQNRAVSAQLSAKPLETADAVRRLCTELEEMKYRAAGLDQALIDRQAADFQDCGNVLLFEPPMPSDRLRRLTDAITQRCGGRCAVFSGEDGEYKFAIGESGGNLQPLVRAMSAALGGRGGGKPNFVQGSVRATRAQIAAYFADGNE